MIRIGDAVEMTEEAIDLKLHKQHKDCYRSFIRTGVVVNLMMDCDVIYVRLDHSTLMQAYAMRFWRKRGCNEDSEGVRKT